MNREKNRTWVKALALAAVFVAIRKWMRMRAWRMAEGVDGDHKAPIHAHAKRFHKLHERRERKPSWADEREEPTSEEAGTVEVAVESATA
jgi:hypothetical protein